MTLPEIRSYLKKHKIDAYFLPRNNMFLEEDILEEENLILALTGFSALPPHWSFAKTKPIFSLMAAMSSSPKWKPMQKKWKSFALQPIFLHYGCKIILKAANFL